MGGINLGAVSTGTLFGEMDAIGNDLGALMPWDVMAKKGWGKAINFLVMLGLIGAVVVVVGKVTPFAAKSIQEAGASYRALKGKQ